MAFRDLREWISWLEESGEVKRIKAEVDWNREIGAIARLSGNQGGPALFFENIKDHKKTRSTKLFMNDHGTRERAAMAIGLDRSAGFREITTAMKQRFLSPVKAETVSSGPVKENIVRGEDVDLFQFPVPQWHHRDGAVTSTPGARW